MSNTQVGGVYAQIIADVVDSSRVDFEEGGVDEHVLEALRRGWEQKLSQLGVATFPWDPKIEPQAPVMSGPGPVNLPTLPSNNANATNYQMSAPLPQMPTQPVPSTQRANEYAPRHTQEQRIKTEPGMDNSTMGTYPGYQTANSTMSQPERAAQRAIGNLNSNYGQRADASINAIHANAHPTGQQQPSHQQMQAHAMRMQQQQQQRAQQGSSNGMMQQPRPQMTQQEYQKAMAMNAQQERMRIQSQNGVGGAQTDGAGEDFDGPAVVIKRVNANGQEELGRLEIDDLIRDKIAARGQSMEGGGLMLPLHQATNSKKRQRKVVKTASSMQQTDGVGSDDDDNKDGVKDEDVDEDAINSDLDDPDDGLDDDEDDEDGMGHIMLCMYDKVQRVKNKWKCVMKDGVLTINGKEYVFHRAQGEYEW